MSRYDEWRREREARGMDRNQHEERNRRDSFYPGNYGFEDNADSGRTAGGEDRQPYSQNPYGRYPGQHQRGGREEWRSSSEQRWGRERYGQREPYNPSGDRGSRYSESQYGADRGRGSSFDRGPFRDTHDSPRYFGAGNYADGGASYGGGYDDREAPRPYGSLYGSEESHLEEQYRPPQQPRYRSGPKGYTRSDDRLREEISERLMMADGIDASEVSLTVKDAKVTLEGSVPHRRMKHAIEDLADQCPGVQDVDNRIRVQRPEWGSSSNNASASSAISTPGAKPRKE